MLRSNNITAWFFTASNMTPVVGWRDGGRVADATVYDNVFRERSIITLAPPFLHADALTDACLHDIHEPRELGYAFAVRAVMLKTVLHDAGDIVLAKARPTIGLARCVTVMRHVCIVGGHHFRGERLD
jgi:hypothetical protein